MNERKKEFFPDRTPIDDWFYDTKIPTVEELGTQYNITEYGVLDDGKIYTQELQALIDLAAKNGGGVIVVPKGTYYTGALFFKQGVQLYVSEGGMLKGSDDISDYPVCQTRIEGQSCLYYPALINADGIDGFMMCGKGTIDGNGLRSWKAFWQRREWNPQCTNKDEQRARLVYLSNCTNAVIADLHLQNSQFWTNHIYKCNRVKFLGIHVFSPKDPVPAPSTDAIDIDACTDVLIKGCYMQVNDDAVALKGGKGPWADVDENNGANERIIMEDCHYGFCHSALTCGSEAIHNKNILMRRIKLEGINQALHMKMRLDTPQFYEYITVEKVEGSMHQNFINISPWGQFCDLKGREDKLFSKVENVVLRDCNCTCNCFFSVDESERYAMSDFTLQNMQIKATHPESFYDRVDRIQLINVNVEKL